MPLGPEAPGRHAAWVSDALTNELVRTFSLVRSAPNRSTEWSTGLDSWSGPMYSSLGTVVPGAQEYSKFSDWQFLRALVEVVLIGYWTGRSECFIAACRFIRPNDHAPCAFPIVCSTAEALDCRLPGGREKANTGGAPERPTASAPGKYVTESKAAVTPTDVETYVIDVSR